MSKQPISTQQFVEKLQVIVNQPIWRVIHPADGWLFLDLGKQYNDYISNKDGSEKSYTKGEYQLHIKSNWEITQNGIVIASRVVKKNETQEEYFSRLENLAKNFPCKSFTRIQLTNDEIMFSSGDGYQLEVAFTGHDDNLGFTIVQVSASNDAVAYSHLRYDETLKSLAIITSR